MRSSGSSCRLVTMGNVGSGSGGIIIRFTRLGLGADTAMASSRSRTGRKLTPVGDDMVAAVSAAAAMRVAGTLSLVLDSTRRQRKRMSMTEKSKPGEIIGRRTTDRLAENSK